jgi:hypothetical protein
MASQIVKKASIGVCKNGGAVLRTDKITNLEHRKY